MSVTDHPMKIAVIGAGLIGRRHAQLVADHGHLVAIVDPSPAAALVARELGCAHFAQIGDCLNALPIDGAIVATPNDQHVPIAKTLVAHDITALIEKPIAATSSEALSLITLAKERDVPLLVGHHRRHNPIIKAAKETIDSGKLGRLTLIDAKFWLYKPDDYFDQGWRSLKGAGPIFINLIHDIDLLRHLCGEITSVQSIQSNRVRGFDVEDTAVGLLEFENGALGTVSISDTTVAPWSWEFSAGENPAYPHTPGAAYHIGGTHGALSVPDLVVWQQNEPRSWWAPIQSGAIKAKSTDALTTQYLHFVDVIRHKVDPLVTGQSATQSLKVIEAIISSGKNGQRTAIA